MNKQSEKNHGAVEQKSIDSSFTFDGQQEGERVLYVIRLHGIKKIINIAQGLLLAIVFYAVLSFVPEFVDVNPQYFRALIAIIAALIFILRVWWGELYCEYSKTILTDRRIIRFEFTLPFFKSRRALFWKEVAKVKTTAHNPIFA
ncbi:MAG: hypothetical protein GYA55_04745, partial [SAR324 cluster bacterium]|nr:hypothetical protein [SAR324 cluster bacterium]